MSNLTLDNIKTWRDKYNMALMVCSKSDNPKFDKHPAAAHPAHHLHIYLQYQLYV